MTVETKFDLGQSVYIIHESCGNKQVDCKPCSGKGGIFNDDVYFQCSKCYGSGKVTKHESFGWRVVYEKAKVGKINIELTHPKYKEYSKRRIHYMVDATGVGSGSLWSEDNIFSTLEEAQQECDKRNKKKSL